MKNRSRVFVTQPLLREAGKVLEAFTDLTYNLFDRPLTEEETNDFAAGSHALVSPKSGLGNEKVGQKCL
jgi:hypothetical protein